MRLLSSRRLQGVIISHQCYHARAECAELAPQGRRQRLPAADRAGVRPTCHTSSLPCAPRRHPHDACLVCPLRASQNELVYIKTHGLSYLAETGRLSSLRQVLNELLGTIVRHLGALHKLLDAFALLDLLAGFAAFAAAADGVYVRPQLSETG